MLCFGASLDSIYLNLLARVISRGCAIPKLEGCVLLLRSILFCKMIVHDFMGFEVLLLIVPTGILLFLWSLWSFLEAKFLIFDVQCFIFG